MITVLMFLDTHGQGKSLCKLKDILTALYQLNLSDGIFLFTSLVPTLVLISFVNSFHLFVENVSIISNISL